MCVHSCGISPIAAIAINFQLRFMGVWSMSDLISLPGSATVGEVSTIALFQVAKTKTRSRKYPESNGLEKGMKQLQPKQPTLVKRTCQFRPFTLTFRWISVLPVGCVKNKHRPQANVFPDYICIPHAYLDSGHDSIVWKITDLSSVKQTPVDD